MEQTVNIDELIALGTAERREAVKSGRSSLSWARLVRTLWKGNGGSQRVTDSGYMQEGSGALRRTSGSRAGSRVPAPSPMSDGHVLAIISNLCHLHSFPLGLIARFPTDWASKVALYSFIEWSSCCQGEFCGKGYFRIGISKEVMSGVNQNVDWELTT